MNAVFVTKTDDAFNRGSDARLRGIPLQAIPEHMSDWSLSSWVMGWKHVDRFWGVDARRPVRPLPRIYDGRESA